MARGGSAFELRAVSVLFVVVHVVVLVLGVEGVMGGQSFAG